MKTIEEVIDNIVDEHKACRWMDAGELREYLEVIAQEQKAIDIENALKACENELRRLKNLLNESGSSSNLISVGKSLSNIRKEMEE